MVQKFATKYTPKKVIGFTCTDESRTEQCFKDECDINNIVKKPNLGINPFAPRYEQAQFGDFSELKTFTEAMNIVTKAQQKFDQLPSAIRDRFNGDPQQFLDFVNDPKNIDEGIELGIYEKRKVQNDIIETPSNLDVSASQGGSTTPSEPSA